MTRRALRPSAPAFPSHFGTGGNVRTVPLSTGGLATARAASRSSSELPALPASWVRRDRLEARLAEATRRKVTVLTGMRGSGKTVLVSGWARSWPGEVSWLSPVTDDPSGSFIDELAEVLLHNPTRPVRIARAKGHPAGSANRIDLRRGDSRPALIVVDDVHSIEDRSMAAELERLIVASDPDTRLILIGRHPGAVSLARLGLTTDVAEIRAKELEFNLEETAALLGVVAGAPIDEESALPLFQLTEGWAVALRLAAVQLGGSFSPRAVADDLDSPGGPVWEYLETEVLSEIPSEDLEFLVQTSVEPEVTPELCEVVTGRIDARRLLDTLAMQHRFVEQTNVKGSYAYHPCFRAHLNQRLARDGQQAIAEAHRKAADWFVKTGDEQAAMRHYVRADAEDLALALGVTETIRHLITGRLGGEDALLPGEISPCYFAADPVRIYALAASLLCASRLHEAAEWLGRLEIGLGAGTNATMNRARTEFLWAIHDSESCDAKGVLAHFEAGREFLDQVAQRAGKTRGLSWLQPLDNAVMALLPWVVAKAQAELGQPEGATVVLDRHIHFDQQPAGTLALGSLASVALASGRLTEALGFAHRAIDTPEPDHQSTVLRIESHMALAGVLFEQDTIDAAREELGKARKLAQTPGLNCWEMVVDCDSARITLSEGNPSRALRQVQAIRENGMAEPVPTAVELKLSQLEFRCRLAMGDIDRARSSLAHIPQSARRPDSQVRIHLCAGRPDRAALELERAPSPTAIRDRIEALLLRARINLQLGNPRVAEHALDEALDLAQPEHFVRVFLEQPQQVLEALRSIGANRSDRFTEELLSRVASRTAGKSSPHVSMLEPLTERERELVAFLPSHLSQYEIAREMYISANTVKTHIKGLYRKLGANSRSEAVELAKSCGLL